MVTRTKKSEHITPVLMNLHWLPISARIEFKVLMIVFKIVHGNAPVYLQSLLRRQASVETQQISSRTRSAQRRSAEILLEPGTYQQKHFGARAFSHFAPALWNALPSVLRSSPTVNAFKSALKTHLFKQHFT